MSLREHVAILRSSAWLIILSFVTAVIASLLATAIMPRSFEARATLSVGQALNSENVNFDDLLASQLLARTYSRLVTTGPLLEAAIDRAHLETSADNLRNRIRTEVQPEDTLIDIVVRDQEADQAARVANALAEELLARIPESAKSDVASINEQIAALDASIATINPQLGELLALTSPSEEQVVQLEALTRRLDALTASRGGLNAQLPASSPGKLSLVDPAIVPDSPAGPGLTVVMLLSALVALIVSVGLAYAMAAWRVDRKLEDPPESVLSTTQAESAGRA